MYHYLQWHYAHVNWRYLQIMYRYWWGFFLNAFYCLWVQDFSIQGTAVGTQKHVVRIPGKKWELLNNHFHIMVTTSQFFQKCTFWAAATRQACAFCADPLVSSEPHIAIALSAVHDLHSKQSFAWPHYFLSWYIMCKVHIAVMSVYIQYLCEKWVYKNVSKILVWSRRALHLHTELTVQRL